MTADPEEDSWDRLASDDPAVVEAELSSMSDDALAVLLQEASAYTEVRSQDNGAGDVAMVALVQAEQVRRWQAQR